MILDGILYTKEIVRQEIRRFLDENSKELFRTIQEQDKSKNRLEDKFEEVLPGHYVDGCVFYIIQVLPRDNRRYKFGISVNILSRMQQHRVIAPDCLLIRKYPCNPLNEKHLLAIIKDYRGVVKISNEVADIFDFKGFLGYMDAIFKTMKMKERYSEPYEIIKDLGRLRKQVTWS